VEARSCSDSISEVFVEEVLQVKKILVGLTAAALLSGCSQISRPPPPETVCDGFLTFDWVRVKNQPDVDYTIVAFDFEWANAYLSTRNNQRLTDVVASCTLLERVNR
jgi:hypothetical protein